MAHETFSVNIDSIHDQVHTAVRELCSAAERIRRVAAALEGSVEELVSHAPTEHLLQAGAVAKAHASGILQSIMDVAAKAERLEAIAAIREAADSKDKSER